MNKEQEIQILSSLLDKLKIYDIYLSFDDSGVLQARDDDGNRWTGKAFYRFLTEECLCFGVDGNLVEGQYVPEDVLEPYKKLSAENGVIPGHPEDVFPRYLDKYGHEIRPGMTLLMEDGSLELIYKTTDSFGNDDLGISATNKAFLERHPDWDQEFYSLSNFALSHTVICLAEKEIRSELGELEAFIQGTELGIDYNLKLPEGDYERYQTAIARRDDLKRMLAVSEKDTPDHKDVSTLKDRRDAR